MFSLKLWGQCQPQTQFPQKTKKKKKRKTACDFQTMAINSFVIPHDLMRGQMGTYAYLQQTSSYLQFQDGRTVKYCPKKHMYTKQ